ncbi:MAG: hypothetical protein M1343_11830 [Chloroflexi bacterium]|nr:hypothetical protein [Chloroflexota bacterium]MDA8189161.1 hypothetical protein [Dehalococcoidales bacterium]
MGLATPLRTAVGSGAGTIFAADGIRNLLFFPEVGAFVDAIGAVVGVVTGLSRSEVLGTAAVGLGSSAAGEGAVIVGATVGAILVGDGVGEASGTVVATTMIGVGATAGALPAQPAIPMIAAVEREAGSTWERNNRESKVDSPFIDKAVLTP